MINYSYLEPPSKVSKIKLPKDYVFTKVKNQPIRRIFENVQYESFQLDAISKLKAILKLKQPNIFYKDEQLLKFQYMGNFMNSEVNENIKRYEQWHQNELITVLHKFSREILEYGIIYSYGRDYEYCPVIYVMANRINLKKYTPEHYLNAIHNLLDPLQKHMFVGGIIQKWNVVIDCQNKKIGSNFTLQLMQNCINKIAYSFPFRLKRLIVVNNNQSNSQYVNEINNVLKKVNSEVEVQILANTIELTQYIGVEERQKKYGGNLSNLCQFWPIHTTNKYEQDKTLIYDEQGSQTEYKSVMNEVMFFETQRASPICDLTNSKCNIY